MLERSEDTFETVLLDVLQKTEQIIPLIICENILGSIFANRSVLDETGIDQFTKKRIIREKIKNLRNFWNVLGLLDEEGAKVFGAEVGKESKKFRENLEQLIKQGEVFLKDKQKRQQQGEEGFYFKLCQNVHQFWVSSKDSKKFKEMSKWRAKIQRKVCCFCVFLCGFLCKCVIIFFN